jgi:hypothetical protein
MRNIGLFVLQLALGHTVFVDAGSDDVRKCPMGSPPGSIKSETKTPPKNVDGT